MKINKTMFENVSNFDLNHIPDIRATALLFVNIIKILCYTSVGLEMSKYCSATYFGRPMFMFIIFL
jgi:hypothetical protein